MNREEALRVLRTVNVGARMYGGTEEPIPSEDVPDSVVIQKASYYAHLCGGASAPASYEYLEYWEKRQ